MDYNLEIQKLLVKKESLMQADDRVKVLKEAINLADTHNDLEWGYDLRLDIMDEEYYTARFEERFAAFAWLLEACDQHPDLFDEDDLLWRYRWMLHAARMNANISVEQILNINNDFKTRLQRKGYGLRAFYNDEFRRFYVQNSMDEAKDFLDLREKEKVNDMVCQACELTDSIDYYLRMNDIAKALTIYNDLMAKKYECMRKPFDTFCSFIDYYTKNNEFEKANEMFLKAEDKLQELGNDTSPIGSISILINFLAHYNKEKAWEYFEKYIHWSIGASDEVQFKVAKNLLYLLKNYERRTMNINTNMPWYQSNNSYDTIELYNYYYNNALELAKRFDARNGTNFFIQQLETSNK